MPSPPYIANVSMFPTAKLRRLNRPSGSIGAGVRRSCSTNTPSRSRPPSPGTHTCGLLQPTHRLADQRQHRPGEAEERERGAEPVDRRVRRPRRPRRHCDRHDHQRGDHERDVHGEDPAATTRRRRDTRRRAARSRSRCPTTPSTSRSRRRAPRAGTRPRSPPASSASAAPRTRPAAPGTRSGTRCSARSRTAATRRRTQPTPIENTRRSPNRSPSDPPTRISEPSESRYAFETHCWPASPPPRSARIAGSATLTAVASSPATNDPKIAATKARRLRDPGTRLTLATATNCPTVSLRIAGREHPGTEERSWPRT